MITEVWLVRHGETAWNAEGRFQGWTDIELNATGRDQARALEPLFDSIRFDGIWSSDLVRAIETAQLAIGAPTCDRRLRELHFGEIEGQVWHDLDDETRSGLGEFDAFIAPGGESSRDLDTRVFSFLDDLAPGCHAVFAHGGVIRAASRACGGDGFPGHGSVTRVDWSNRISLDSDDG